MEKCKIEVAAWLPGHEFERRYAVTSINMSSAGWTQVSDKIEIEIEIYDEKETAEDRLLKIDQRIKEITEKANADVNLLSVEKQKLMANRDKLA